MKKSVKVAAERRVSVAADTARAAIAETGSGLILIFFNKKLELFSAKT